MYEHDTVVHPLSQKERVEGQNDHSKMRYMGDSRVSHDSEFMRAIATIKHVRYYTRITHDFALLLCVFVCLSHWIQSINAMSHVNLFQWVQNRRHKNNKFKLFFHFLLDAIVRPALDIEECEKREVELVKEQSSVRAIKSRLSGYRLIVEFPSCVYTTLRWRWINSLRLLDGPNTWAILLFFFAMWLSTLPYR